MPQRRYSAEQVDAAVRALALDGERFAHAQEIVTHAAPGLQQILDEALRAGGFFGAAHDAEVARVAAIEPAEQRVTGVRTLVAEEARMGMLVGVAVGLGLGEQLRRSSGDEHDERSSAT
jgi:hypothetical protein